MHETVRPDVESRRSARRRRFLSVAVVAVVLSIAAPIAWASHLFTDVPDGHQFHDEIAAAQYAGITGGKTCVPAGYAADLLPERGRQPPGDGRFLTRGFSRTAFDKTSPRAAVTFSAADSTLAVVTIEIGGVLGARRR